MFISQNAHPLPPPIPVTANQAATLYAPDCDHPASVSYYGDDGGLVRLRRWRSGWHWTSYAAYAPKREPWL